MEGIGTFFLVLIATVAFSIGGSLGPFAIGAGIAALVYMGQHISGAHYNPAVSLAMYINGKLSLVDLAIYVGVQLVGGFAAAGIHGLLVEIVDADAAYKLVIEPQSPAIIFAGTLVEILFTFLLVMVVLNATQHPKAKGNSFYGTAYGLTVFVGVLLFRDISGGSFNPALTLGPNVINYAYAASPEVWLSAGVGGPLVGGALAGFVYQVLVSMPETPAFAQRHKKSSLSIEMEKAAEVSKSASAEQPQATDQPKTA